MNKNIYGVSAIMILLIAGLGFFAYRQDQKISMVQRSLERVESRPFVFPGEVLGIVREESIPEEVVNGMLGKIKAIENGAIIMSVEFLEGKKVQGFPFVDAKVTIDANTKFREEVIPKNGKVEIVDKENFDISELRRGTTIFVRATGSITSDEVLAKEIEVIGQIRK